MLAKSTGGAMVKAGGDSWFFITADYAFGHALERDTTDFVAGGGRQGGRPRAAIRSRAPRISPPSGAGAGLRRQGARPGQCRRRHRQRIKQAAEFGLTTKMRHRWPAADVHHGRSCDRAATWRRAWC